MELLGVGGILFWAGLVMFAAGQACVWTRVAKYGGLDKMKTLSVVFDEESPMKRPENRGDRMIFRAGVFLVAFGLMTTFSGVTAGDQRALVVCANACRREGFQGGRFAPSGSEKDPSGRPLRACWCVGAAGSSELPQGKMLPPSMPMLPGSAGH